MNGKLSRELRKVANMNTVGRPKKETRKFYQGLKKFYKGMRRV